MVNLMYTLWLKNKISKDKLEKQIIPIIGKYYVNIEIYIVPQKDIGKEAKRGYELKKRVLEEKKAFELDDDYEKPDNIDSKKAMVVVFSCEEPRFEFSDIDDFQQIIIDLYNDISDGIYGKLQKEYYFAYVQSEIEAVGQNDKAKMTTHMKMEYPKLLGLTQTSHYSYSSK